MSREQLESGKAVVSEIVRGLFERKGLEIARLSWGETRDGASGELLIAVSGQTRRYRLPVSEEGLEDAEDPQRRPKLEAYIVEWFARSAS
jgi:hypothetical protein